MNQKERLEEIREKHKKEQEKRKILIHRLAVAVTGVIIIMLIACLIKSCVSSIESRREEKCQKGTSQEIQVTEIPALPDENGIIQAYFETSAFIGNSFAEGMSIYSLIDGADYFSRVGLNVNTALTETTVNDTIPVIDKLKNDKQYKKIFMIFGENELGWISSDSFSEQYEILIDKVREYQPQARLYLLSITPVTKKVSEENKDNTNNESIKMYNAIIRALAESEGADYADIYSAVVDKDGNLPEGAAGDGIHFGEEYYKKCLVYMQNNLH